MSIESADTEMRSFGDQWSWLYFTHRCDQRWRGHPVVSIHRSWKLCSSNLLHSSRFPRRHWDLTTSSREAGGADILAVSVGLWKVLDIGLRGIDGKRSHRRIRSEGVEAERCRRTLLCLRSGIPWGSLTPMCHDDSVGTRPGKGAARMMRLRG